MPNNGGHRYEKGHKKFGGRKKGTPNKRTLELRERAEQLGVDPFEILLLFAKEDWQTLGYDSRTMTRYSTSGMPYEVFVIEPSDRMKAAAEAVQYLEAKRKAIEVSGPDGAPVESLVAVDLSTLSTDELLAIKKVMTRAQGNDTDKN